MLSYIKKLQLEMEALRAENKRLYELAFVDDLTQAYNRNWISQGLYDQSECKLLLIDLNNLKKINDLHGHTAGDKYLLDNANKLKAHGTLVRWGGDEFLLFLPIDFDENSLRDKNYSFGVTIKKANEDIYKAIIRADKNMYKDKKHKEEFMAI